MGKSNSESSLPEDRIEKSPYEVEVGTSSSGGEEIDEKKLLRYIDFRIIPILACTYAFSLIDRSNLGSARVAGMGQALHLEVGTRYSIVTCVYFITYILLEFPAMAMVRKVGVRIWLTFMVTGWGAVTVGTGFIKHWGFLALCRTLMGVFEAGFFPATVFVITWWYKRHEVQTRIAAFFLSSGLISGFGPIVAYGLSRIPSTHGIAGWSWIFIIEGAITVALAFACWFLIPEFPDNNTFLTKAQTAFVLKRVEEDRGDSLPDQITPRKMVHHLKDWKLWTFGGMLVCNALPAYMLAFFLPVILAGMKYNTSHALLLTSPPFAVAFITAMTFSFLSDRNKHRCGFVLIQATLTLIGCCMTAFADISGVRYAGTFFMCCGSSGCIPSVLAWMSNNVVSHSKRSVSSVFAVTGIGIGGILASTIFRQQDAPRYIPGLWVTIAAQIMLISLSIGLAAHLARQNRLLREGHLSEPLEGQEGFQYTI